MWSSPATRMTVSMPIMTVGWYATKFSTRRRQIIDFVLRGDIFALQACLFKRSLHSVVTVTPATLSLVHCNRIATVSKRNPALSQAMFWSAVREAARLAEHLTDAARRSTSV